MGLDKKRFTIYLTDKNRECVRNRAQAVGKNMSDYIAELIMWDKRFKLVENARDDKVVIQPGHHDVEDFYREEEV